MGFSFTATAECDYCGQLLGSSDEECDHDSADVETRVFRRIGEGRDSLVGVQATPGWKWYKLAREVGEEEWLAYEYLGDKSYVNRLLQFSDTESVEELPKLHISVDAPDDVRDRAFDD